MRLKKLHLKYFRNLKNLEFSPGAGVNFIVGKNGQGKTSVLEAISVLAGLKSFRSSKASDWIHFESPFSDVEAEVAISSAELKLRITLERKSSGSTQRIARINDKVMRSSLDYLTQKFGPQDMGFHAVVFNPSDHDLVRDEPAIRRQYLDRVISAFSPEYLRNLQRYRRILEHRNALLEELRLGRGSKSVLVSLDETLVEHGAPMVEERCLWLRAASPLVQTYSKDIAPGQKTTLISYISKWLDDVTSPLQGPMPSIEIIKHSFQKGLESNFLAEIRAGTTLVGPHRDDWAFGLGESPLKGHGSQGEVRTALLALKLAEIQHFREATGKLPLLLLDDFSSELDQERREYLLRFLRSTDLQVVVTTTDAEASLGRKFEMIDGKMN